jgi:hypothetical protein
VTSGQGIMHRCRSSISEGHLRLSSLKDEEYWGGQVSGGVDAQSYDGEKGTHGSRWAGGTGAVCTDWTPSGVPHFSHRFRDLYA